MWPTKHHSSPVNLVPLWVSLGLSTSRTNTMGDPVRACSSTRYSASEILLAQSDSRKLPAIKPATSSISTTKGRRSKMKPKRGAESAEGPTSGIIPTPCPEPASIPMLHPNPKHRAGPEGRARHGLRLIPRTQIRQATTATNSNAQTRGFTGKGWYVAPIKKPMAGQSSGLLCRLSNTCSRKPCFTQSCGPLPEPLPIATRREQEYELSPKPVSQKPGGAII